MRSKAQDAQATLEAIGNEINALTQHTGVEAFLFAVKPDHGFNLPAQFIMTEKASHFLFVGMKKAPSDLLKELELFVVGDIESLVINHNERLTQIKGKISQEIKAGLCEITGQNMSMQYEQYMRLVADHGIIIRNWPEEVPFMNPSKIGSLYHVRILLEGLCFPDSNQRCKWDQLSEDEWKTKREEYMRALGEKDEEPAKKKKKVTKVSSDKENKPTGETNMDKKEAKERSIKKRAVVGKDNNVLLVSS
ncbi:hypothetical protein BU17DRAFT_93798 [Hysterangium stoloniferum]|nr:hypothetical protein BU17DRAFT_93798 [Hysterangium stoloniferum]